MNIKEFMAMDAPQNYDFSNDGAGEEYQLLDNFEHVEEKFFGYMAMAKAYEQDDKNVMKYGADYSQECKKKYIYIPDPDSKSKLLQEIYSKLWDEDILKHCKKGMNICGDTMNSQNTTLGVWYGCVETPAQEKERKQIKSGGRFVQTISIRYILSRYVEDKMHMEEQFAQTKGLKRFTAGYHTLGNFMPVPVNCNGPRGTNKVKDYWDLTLNIIYEYYVNGVDRIEDIVGENMAGQYKAWLEAFVENDTGKTGWIKFLKKNDARRMGWKNFVEKNFLQDFVHQDSSDIGYGRPKELWKGHFTGTVLPGDMKQIEQFYVNASNWIEARSQRMLDAM